MQSIQLPERISRFAGEGEVRFDAQSLAGLLGYSLAVALLLVAAFTGWLLWEFGYENLREDFAQDWYVLLLIVLITPLLIVGWNVGYRGAFNSVILKETELVLTARRGGHTRRIPWRRIVGVSRVRNRAGLGLTVKIKDPKEKIKLGAAPFDAVDLEALHEALLEASTL